MTIEVRRGLRVVLGLGACVAVTGCRAAEIEPLDALTVELPEAWSRGADLAESAKQVDEWWTSFGSAELDGAVEAALGGNLDLAAAWSRLRQANSSARGARAEWIPTLDLDASASTQTIEQSGGDAGNAFFNGPTERYTIPLSAAYEIDLFGRIDSSVRAAEYEAQATAEDAAATALTLSGTAVEAWIDAVEAAAQTDLVRRQIEVGEQLLQVTEQRFARGGGGALAVLQQRRQLEGTRAELPLLISAKERAEYRLAVLAGVAPGGAEVRVETAVLPELPALPALGSPGDLLQDRPELRAALRRVAAADASVAEAIALRYPRLSVSASYSFDAFELADLFNRTVTSILGNLTLPLIDGGSRRAEVERRRDVLEASVQALGAALLVALREVEDALSLEAALRERLDVLGRQAALAGSELEQAERRYSSGVDSYLEVLSAVQVLQQLERQLVVERADLIQNRARLHRALGGWWMLGPNSSVARTENSEPEPGQRGPGSIPERQL